MKPNRKTTCSLFWVALVMLGMAAYCEVSYLFGQLWERNPIHFEGLSLEEARALAPYEICVPSYLPANIDTEPVIPYLSVSPDDRAELVLIYHPPGAAYPSMSTAHTTPFVELRQSYSPLEQSGDDVDLASLKKSLVVWLVGWDEVEKVIDEATARVTRQWSNGSCKWLVEITEPGGLRGSVVSWKDDKVSYELCSLSDSEETLKIADSVCDDSQATD